MRVDPNQKLLDLDPNLMRQLEDALQKDDSWRKIAELLKEYRWIWHGVFLVQIKRLSNVYRHLSGRKLLDLSRCEYPATRLLEELKTKLYEVRHLKVVLQRCQLYAALSVIADPGEIYCISSVWFNFFLHTEPLVIIRQPSSFLQGNEILKAKIGDPLILECDVFGVPPPKYSWLLNGLPIPGKYSSVLNYNSYEWVKFGLLFL